MNNQKLHLLILEDNPNDVELIVRELEKNGFVFEWKRVETEKAFKKALAEKPDIILADYKLPSFNGMAAIKLQQEISPDIPLIFVSGTIGEELAIDCLKAGAMDYVLKDRLSRLALIVKRSLKEAKERNELKQAEKLLIESEEKYRTLVESLEEGITSVDENENFTFVNKAASKIFGYSNEELLKMGLKDLTTPEEYKKIIKQTSIRKTGKTSKYEVNIIKKNGSYAIISITSSPLFDDNKKYKGGFGIFHDITELERAKNELQISEERFQQVAENAQEWIWEVNTNGLYTYSSPIVEMLLGYKPEEIVGKKHFYDLFCPEAKEELKKAAFEVFNKKHAFREFINRNKHKDGRTVFLSTSGSPILDENGELLGYRGADIDITESKQAEEAIRESEEKYRSLTEHLNVGVYRNTFGAEGRFIEANPSIVEMFGYKKKNEFLKLKVADLYKNPDERKKFNEKMISEGFVRNEEIQLQKRDGTPFFGSVSAVVVKDEKGKLKYYDGIMEDITERKLVEEALKDSEEKYRTLIEHVQDGFFLIQDGLMKLVNPAFAATVGYKVEEIIGMDFRKLVAHEDVEMVVDNYRRRQAGEKVPPQYEFRMLCKDGKTKINILMSVGIVNFMGKIASLGTTHDITERKKAEEQLKKKNEELSAFNKLVVGRELRIIELKSEINKLLRKLGQKERFKIVE